MANNEKSPDVAECISGHRVWRELYFKTKTEEFQPKNKVSCLQIFMCNNPRDLLCYGDETQCTLETFVEKGTHGLRLIGMVNTTGARLLSLNMQTVRFCEIPRPASKESQGRRYYECTEYVAFGISGSNTSHHPVILAKTEGKGPTLFFYIAMAGDLQKSRGKYTIREVKTEYFNVFADSPYAASYFCAYGTGVK